MIGLIPLILGGCATPLVQAIGYVSTTYDVSMVATGNQTTTDSIISSVVSGNCATANIFKGDDYCEYTPSQLLKQYYNENRKELNNVSNEETW